MLVVQLFQPVEPVDERENNMSRTIVSSGRYNLTQTERSSHILRVFGGATTQPENQDSNFKYNKYSTYYGYAQLCRGDLVLQTKQLNFDGELLFEVVNDPMNLAKVAQYCSRLFVLNLNANEWTQYTALPFTLVSLALQTFFFDQLLSVDPPILSLQIPDSIRFKLYSTTVYKVIVETLPYDLCSDASQAVFQEVDLPDEPSDFMDTPTPQPPSAPYLPIDPDTPGGNPGGGLGGSGLTPGVPFGDPNKSYLISWSADLPGGGCSGVPPELVESFTSCSTFPKSGTLTVEGTFIPDVVRVPTISGTNGLAFVDLSIFQVSSATDIGPRLFGLGYSSTTPSFILEASDWTISNAEVVSFSVSEI